jgi:SAM-dependent methyltransferase
MEVLCSTHRFAARDAKFLEIACGDGRVAAAMARAGKDITAIDISPERLSGDARQAGVKFLAMDAERLHLPPESFDVVYSFDAFEHFQRPEQVLAQIGRVLRPGGVVYGSFGPLYYSAHGAHQWHSVDAPYCHLLFAEEDLNRAATARGKIPLVRNLNRWRLRDYRAMFYRSLDVFEKIHYFEKFNVTHVDLVLAFPSIFRSRTDAFDDLIVRSIEFLLRKRG